MNYSGFEGSGFWFGTGFGFLGNFRDLLLSGVSTTVHGPRSHGPRFLESIPFRILDFLFFLIEPIDACLCVCGVDTNRIFPFDSSFLCLLIVDPPLPGPSPLIMSNFLSFLPFFNGSGPNHKFAPHMEKVRGIFHKMRRKLLSEMKAEREKRRQGQQMCERGSRRRENSLALFCFVPGAKMWSISFLLPRVACRVYLQPFIFRFRSLYKL